jgi:hypothetical protein
MKAAEKYDVVVLGTPGTLALRSALLHGVGYHHAHRSLASGVVTQSLNVEEKPVGIGLQRRVMVEWE